MKKIVGVCDSIYLYKNGFKKLEKIPKNAFLVGCVFDGFTQIFKLSKDVYEKIEDLKFYIYSKLKDPNKYEIRCEVLQKESEVIVIAIIVQKENLDCKKYDYLSFAPASFRGVYLEHKKEEDIFIKKDKRGYLVSIFIKGVFFKHLFVDKIDEEIIEEIGKRNRVEISKVFLIDVDFELKKFSVIKLNYSYSQLAILDYLYSKNNKEINFSCKKKIDYLLILVIIMIFFALFLIYKIEKVKEDLSNLKSLKVQEKRIDLLKLCKIKKSKSKVLVEVLKILYNNRVGVKYLRVDGNIFEFDIYGSKDNVLKAIEELKSKKIEIQNIKQAKNFEAKIRVVDE